MARTTSHIKTYLFDEESGASTVGRRFVALCLFNAQSEQRLLALLVEFPK